MAEGMRMERLETRTNNLEIGVEQFQVEASCYRAKCATTRKAITEECIATTKGIKGLRRQLDDFLILFSHKFKVSIPAECFFKEYSASLSQIGDES